MLDAKADSVFFNDRHNRLTAQINFYSKLIEQCESGALDYSINSPTRVNQPFIMLASQSNVIKNNSNAYDNIMDENVKLAVQKYIAKYEYIVYPFKNFNSKVNEYFIPLRVKYHKQMPELFEVKSVAQLSFLCNEESDIGIVKLVKSYAINTLVHTENFLKINNTFTDSLNKYLNLKG